MLWIWSVVAGAFAEPRLHWRALLAALLVPAAALSLLGLAEGRLSGSHWAYAVWVGQTVIQALFAISCHRIVLLGDRSLENRWGVHWSARETRFLLWFVLPGLLVGAALFLPILVLSDVVLFIVRCVAGAYVLARASLILPATAIDQQMSFRSAWELSRGNGWRLAVALAVPGLLFSALEALHADRGRG